MQLMLQPRTAINLATRANAWLAACTRAGVCSPSGTALCLCRILASNHERWLGLLPGIRWLEERTTTSDEISSILGLRGSFFRAIVSACQDGMRSRTEEPG
jgi:hypothetical protein